MTNEIQMYIKENVEGETAAPMIWDAANRSQLCPHKKKLKQRKLLGLQNQLKQLESSHAQNQDARTLQQVRTIRNEMNSMYIQEIEKKMLFTRQRYYENGSKFTKLLARKLKKKYASNTIYKIRDPEKKKQYRKQTRTNTRDF